MKDIRKQSDEQASNNKDGDDTNKEEPNTEDFRNVGANSVTTKSVEQSEMHQEVQLSNNLEKDANDDSDFVFHEVVDQERIEEDISSHVNKVSCDNSNDISDGIIAKFSSLGAKLNSEGNTKASIVGKTKDSGNGVRMSHLEIQISKYQL